MISKKTSKNNWKDRTYCFLPMLPPSPTAGQEWPASPLDLLTGTARKQSQATLVKGSSLLQTSRDCLALLIYWWTGGSRNRLSMPGSLRTTVTAIHSLMYSFTDKYWFRNVYPTSGTLPSTYQVFSILSSVNKCVFKSSPMFQSGSRHKSEQNKDLALFVMLFLK